MFYVRREFQKVGRSETSEAGGPTVEEELPGRHCQNEYHNEVSGVVLDRKPYRHQREGLTPTREIQITWKSQSSGGTGDQEAKQHRSWSRAAPFASTLPLQGVRMLISLAESGQQSLKRDDRRVLEYDGTCVKQCGVKTPPEDKSIRIRLASFTKAMRDVRDLGQGFDVYVCM